jgi:hypothetical protein
MMRNSVMRKTGARPDYGGDARMRRRASDRASDSSLNQLQHHFS